MFQTTRFAVIHDEMFLYTSDIAYNDKNLPVATVLYKRRLIILKVAYMYCELALTTG